jgi:hypothetical protein
MEELERRDKCSNSLLANVLDMDDDFLAGMGTDKVWFGQYFRRDQAMTGLLKVQYFWRDHIGDKVWLGNYFWWELTLIRFGLESIFGGNWR